MALTICFIDDSPFERDLFTRVLGRTRNWDPVVAETFEQAREMLGERIPLLWLLDLWGNDPAGSARPKLMDPDDLERKAKRIPGPGYVWDGLEDFSGDRPNEYLKRFYTIVSGWSGLFLEAARAADQTRAYGLHNLARVRERYPETAALAYTRKSQSADLAAFLKAGGDGVLLKPHGPDDRAILEATRDAAPELIHEAHRVLDRCLLNSLLRQSLVLGNAEGAYLFSLAGALLGRSPLPRKRDLEAGPYLRAWAEAARARIEDKTASPPR